MDQVPFRRFGMNALPFLRRKSRYAAPYGAKYMVKRVMQMRWISVNPLRFRGMLDTGEDRSG